ncbi:autotransporter domain-containing protein [Mesorhizobium sp. WSM2239]|uniref:Autotransporter domain-containing protein n=2 Tax=unclassified Mesorhizobium TaxID=325217 RepID=A0AAU8DIE7_9HYPH
MPSHQRSFWSKARRTTSVLAIAAVLGGWALDRALAACSDNTPDSGDTVLCSPAGGPDTTGVNAPAASNVTVEVSGPGGGIQTGSAQAIYLGDSATIRTDNDAPVESGYYAVQVGDDANITAGNILSSGKGVNALRAGDRLTLLLQEGGSIVASGSGGTGIFAGDDADLTISGAVRTTGIRDPDEIGIIGATIFTRDRARIVVTETGSVEGSGSGAPGITAWRDSSIRVDGSVVTRGDSDVGEEFASYSNAIEVSQGSTVVIGESGVVQAFGAQANAVALQGNVDSYSSSLLGRMMVAGRVEAFGDMGAGIFVSAAQSFFGPPPGVDHPQAFIDVGEGGVVSSERFIGIYEEPTSLRRLPVDTTVRLAGTVSGSASDGIAVFLGAGDDQLILLPTYSLIGVSIGSELDTEGNVTNGPDEIDRFVLDGAAGTEGRFAFNQDEEQILGFEEFRKTGAGRWILDGNSSDFTASGEVTAGELVVDADIAGLDIYVAPDAVLSGTGRVGSLYADEDGIVAPGDNGRGTLRVAGDVDVSQGSILVIGLDGDGTPARLDAEGIAWIEDGVLEVSVSPQGLSQVPSGVFLSAGGGVDGRFGSVWDDIPDLDVVPIHTPNDVSLGITKGAANGTFSNKDVYPETLSALLETDLSFIRSLRSHGRQDLAGATAAAVAPLAFAKEAGASGSGAEVGSANLANAPRAWIDGMASGIEVDASDDSNGFDARTRGLVAGLDIASAVGGGVLVLGIAGGYTHVDVDVGASGADVDIGRIGLYAGWEGGPWGLTGALAYGRAGIDTSRAFDISGWAATSDTSADLFSGSLAASYNLAPGLGLGPQTVLAPQATLDLASIHRDGFDESGAGILGLSGDDESASRGLAGIGVLLRTRFETGAGWSASPEASIAYQRGFGDRSVESQLAIALAGASFNETAAATARDRLAVGAGVSFKSGGALLATVRYDGAFGSGLNSQTGSVGLMYRF